MKSISLIVLFFHLTTIDDMELFNPGRKKKTSNNQKPNDENDVKKKWKQREDKWARNISDGVTGFSNHLCSNGDPLEAAAEQEWEEASETSKDDTETEPDILVAGDALNDPLSAGEEDVIMNTTIKMEFVVLCVGVHWQSYRETNCASQDTDPHSSHGTTVEQSWNKNKSYLLFWNILFTNPDERENKSK